MVEQITLQVAVPSDGRARWSRCYWQTSIYPTGVVRIHLPPLLPRATLSFAAANDGDVISWIHITQDC